MMFWTKLMDPFSFSTVYLFFGEHCIWSLCFLFITDWFNLDISGQTTSWIALIYSLVCWDCFAYFWHSCYFIMIIHQQNIGICIFWRSKFFINSLYITFKHIQHQSISSIEHLFISFLQNFLLITPISFNFGLLLNLLPSST